MPCLVVDIATVSGWHAVGGSPHPYGQDSLSTIDTRSLEPLSAHRAGMVGGCYPLKGLHCMLKFVYYVGKY